MIAATSCAMDNSHSTSSNASRNRSPAAAGESGAADTGQPATVYPPALVEATLDRVLASRTFRRSQRHRQFLDHVVRAALAGEHERLKEVIIGLEVYGRQLAHYDPRKDPIVRVEAGRVREKLARYYAAEGAVDAFEIVIPVGGYLPHLARRKAATCAASGPSPSCPSLICPATPTMPPSRSALRMN